ncbi:unnamed protein product [Sphagnum troendelagicum]
MHRPHLRKPSKHFLYSRQQQQQQQKQLRLGQKGLALHDPSDTSQMFSFAGKKRHAAVLTMVLILLALAGGLEAFCGCTVLIASEESSCIYGARICNLISVALISPTLCKSTKRSGIRNEKLSCVIPID